MTIQLILATLVGLIIGAIGMAILASGGRADDFEKEAIMANALRKVWYWQMKKSKEAFPKQDIENALHIR